MAGPTPPGPSIDARRSDDDAVAVHGLPNYFRIPGPDVERQLRYVTGACDLLDRSGCHPHGGEVADRRSGAGDHAGWRTAST